MLLELLANLVRVARYELAPRSGFPQCSARITVIAGAGSDSPQA